MSFELTPEDIMNTLALIGKAPMIGDQAEVVVALKAKYKAALEADLLAKKRAGALASPSDRMVEGAQACRGTEPI